MVGPLGVVMVTTSFPRWEGDFAGHFVGSLASAIALRGHRVTVVAPHDPGSHVDETLSGVQVHRVRYAADRFERLAYGDGIVPNLRHNPLVGLAALPLAAGMRRALRDACREADVVHVHWAPTAVLAGVRHADTPTVLTLHGTDSALGHQGGIWGSLLRAGVGSADIVSVVAQAQKEALVGAGMTSRPIEVVPAGVAIELTRRARPPREPDAPLRFLFVGRLIELKGALDLARAFARVAHEIPDTRLTFVGKGPLEAALAEIVASNGLGERVEILGELAHESALGLMASADALVLPSYSEGSPLSVTEALALGTPIVATRVGAVAEIVGDAGLLVEAGDQDSLAGALVEFAAHRERLAALGLAARPRVAAQYGWPTLAERTETLYLRAIESRKGSL